MRYTSLLFSTALLTGMITLAQPGCPSDMDGDGFTEAAGDCNDEDPLIYPGAAELCDGVDNNCDGTTDAEFDVDQDGFTTCADSWDCDDNNPEIYPGRTELCNGLDDNCNGEIDEGLDQDGDGYRLCDGDCDDLNPDISPEAIEVCNGVDDNCDNVVDEGFDQDGDGYSVCGMDCDDLNPLVNPDQTETCNEMDDDCDGSVDEDFDQDLDGVTTCAGDCDDSDPAVFPGATEACNSRDDNCDGLVDDGFDQDGDGFTVCQGDCDDSNAGVNPTGSEVCNSLDDDCDGQTDEGFDLDQDGYTVCMNDCDDADNAKHPGAVETCNAQDDDCDGTVDEGFDNDQDGVTTCAVGTTPGDCDDNDADVYPGAAEKCNGIDDDCDASVDEGFDQDGDGYTSCGGDCNDAKPLIHPSAYEGPETPSTTSDGVDNDCDGYVDIDCDGTSDGPLPLVVLESPARGAYSYTNAISVSGLVKPATSKSPVTSITLENGTLNVQQCSADGGARFSGTAPLEHGLTTLRVRATDSEGGADKAETSVIYSDTYLDVHNSPVEGALVAELNQGSWNILADFLEEFLSADDLEAELLASNPIMNESGDADCLESWKIYGEAIRYEQDDVNVTFTLSGGRIKSTATIVHPQMWVDGYAYYDLEWYCGGWSDTADMDAYLSFSEVTATADAKPSVDANGNIVIDFTNVVVNASNPYLDLNADNWFYDWLVDMAEEKVTEGLDDFIETELANFVSDELGPMAADELNALSLAYDIDAWGTLYGVAFDVDSIDVPMNTVDIGFLMDLSYPVDPSIPANPGAVDFDNYYSRTTSPTVAFKVGFDFFNAALHAMWEGGSLNLSGLINEDPPLYGTAEPLLPPVVTAGQSPYLLELSVGDVLGTLEVPMGNDVETLTAAASAKVQMDLDPVVDGYDIWFDVTFGDVDLSFDMLADMTLTPDLQASMEAGLSEMLTLYLGELEAYLEAQTISYLEIPLQFQDIWIEKDDTNPAMLTVAADASYTGP